jgi:ATP-dependent Clp protease ATP-binding subunit ClpA
MSTRKLDITRKSGREDALSLKFSQRIIGQPKGTQALTDLIEMFESGFYDLTKPVGSALFLGPTGCGKTGAVEAFCEGLYGDPHKMMKVDCGEFQHSHEIAKLIGSPPGYLGHRETHPYFTNAALLAARSGPSKIVTNPGFAPRTVEGPVLQPFTVILWDEIEKASDSVWNLLLGILDKGTLMTGTNEPVDFLPTIHIMTSNVGAAELAVKTGDAGIGFSPLGSEISQQEIEDTAMAAARRKFTPEFLNRIDKVVVFNTLTPDNVNDILSLELNKLQDRVVLGSKQLFMINVSPSAFRQIAKEGYNRRDNARYLQRTIKLRVEQPIAKVLATGQILPNDTIVVDYVEPQWDHECGEWGYYAQAPIARQNQEGGIFP